MGARYTREPRMISKKPVLTLSDSDVVSEPSLSRRSMLGALGIGAGAVAMIGASTAALARDAEHRGRACRLRDHDSSRYGNRVRPGDRARRRCGRTDRD